MIDHVDVLVSISSKYSMSNFIVYLKGKSLFMIYDKHENFKYKCGNSKFCAEGYYTSTVGLNQSMIRKYILRVFINYKNIVKSVVILQLNKIMYIYLVNYSFTEIL